MDDKNESVFEVETVATETQPVIVKGDKQLDITSLLVEIANDVKVIRKELGK